MEEREGFALDQAPGVEELFTAEAFAQLRSDPVLPGRVAVLREREAELGRMAEEIGPLEVNRLCQEHIIQLLDEQDAAKTAVTPENPGAFLQAVFSLPRIPRTAQRRRRVREIARVYRLKQTDALFLPRNVKGFHQLWELAMEGEPRWSEDYPTSAFRAEQAFVVDAMTGGKVLQVCSVPENYEKDLTLLLAVLSDNTLLPEIRAACGFGLFEFIHPFQDGNGHVGRMLMNAVLGRLYHLPVMVCFSQETVVDRGRTLGQFEMIRSRKGMLNDFCLDILSQLEEAQAGAARLLQKVSRIRENRCSRKGCYDTGESEELRVKSL